VFNLAPTLVQISGRTDQCSISDALLCLRHSFFFGFSSSGVACERPAGKVVSLEGVVEIRPARQAPDGIWNKARLQQTLCPGDQITTREGSRAAVELTNQVILRLSQKTTLSLLNVHQEQPSELGLKEGVIHILTRFMRRLTVVTPYLNALVEGTEFTVASQAESRSARITVAEGQVRAVNTFGEQLLTPGLAAQAEANTAPATPLRVQPLEAVQWALYYPVIVNQRSEPALQQANALLARGRVTEARGLIAPYANTATGLALLAVIETAGNQNAQARKLVQRALDIQPDSTSVLLALSYVQQAHAELELATQAAEEATRLDPELALAWVRLAELKLLASDAQAGRVASERALILQPDLSRAQTILGFAELINHQYEAALLRFEQAKGDTGTDPQAWLGSGLTLIRTGALEAGRRHLEIAVMLDPGNAELRTALARAYLEERRTTLAERELELAMRLDPPNPTPWFTRALLKQQANDPWGAAQDYERALSLNDNRAVIRPRLFLNQDQVGRTVSLASAYRDLGFGSAMLSTAYKAVSADPQSSAAHNLLAEAYVALPRYETARVSEQLQAQLRAPLGTAPVATQSLVPNLPIIGGPRALGLHEFSPLFEQKNSGISTGVLAGSQSTRGTSLLAFQTADRWQLSFGHFFYDTQGFRSDSDFKLSANNLLLQAQLRPDAQAQLEVRSVRGKGGDVAQRINPLSAEPERRRELDNDTLRFGLRQALSANSEWLFSAVKKQRDDRARDVSRTALPGGTMVSLDVGLRTTQAKYAEAQFLYQGQQQSLVAGLSLYQDESDTLLETTTSSGLIPVRHSEALINRDLKHKNAYAYFQTSLSRWNLYTGLAVDDFRRQDGFSVHSISPKLGLQYAAPDWNIRAASLRGVKGSAAKEQLLEPTQFAQFNQQFDDNDGTRYQRLALGGDYSWSKQLQTGFEFSKRNLQVYGLGCTASNCTGAWTERAHHAYTSWRFLPQWALSADFLYYSIRSGYQSNSNIPIATVTQQIPIKLNYFHSPSWKLGFEWRSVDQTVNNRILGLATKTGSRFSIFNFDLHYAPAVKSYSFSFEINNLFDKEFRFQNTNLNGDEARVPLFQPGRSVYVRGHLKL
jgi:Tfp pilus assembly protein PilF